MKVKLGVLPYGGQFGVLAWLYENAACIQPGGLTKYCRVFVSGHHQIGCREICQLFEPVTCAHSNTIEVDNQQLRFKSPFNIPSSIVVAACEQLPKRGEKVMGKVTTTYFLREADKAAACRASDSVKYLKVSFGESCELEELPKIHPYTLPDLMLIRKEGLSVEIDRTTGRLSHQRQGIDEFVINVEDFSKPIFVSSDADSEDSPKARGFMRSFRDIDMVVRRSSSMLDQIGLKKEAESCGKELVEKYNLPLHKFFISWEQVALAGLAAHPLACRTIPCAY